MTGRHEGFEGFQDLEPSSSEICPEIVRVERYDEDSRDSFDEQDLIQVAQRYKEQDKLHEMFIVLARVFSPEGTEVRAFTAQIGDYL